MQDQHISSEVTQVSQDRASSTSGETSAALVPEEFD